MLVEFRILGPLEVLAGGRPVALGGPQQRGLLALLLIEANRVVSQDQLVTDLWSDAPPANARGLLHGCVAGLRRVLPADRLMTRPPGYLLRVEAGELDADRVGFRIAAAQALTVLLDVHLTGGDLPQALECGERALALHRSTGHRHGEARTALLLGHARQAAARALLR